MTYEGIVAIHHLALNHAVTAEVFSGEASPTRVFLHAAVLILQTIPLIRLAQVLAGLFAILERLLQGAHVARKESEQLVDGQRKERAEAVRVVQDMSNAQAHWRKGIRKPASLICRAMLFRRGVESCATFSTISSNN